MLKEYFVGTWKGSDHGTLEENEVNFWTVIRTLDGRFYVEFATHYSDGRIEHTSEQGLWYVDGNYFYEQREGEEVADVYTYKFLSSHEIFFQDISSDYSFIDRNVAIH